MRLWHQALISRLPRAQLLGQHREICALRGNGWQKKHATVNYCFEYSPYKLYQFHLLVLQEMLKRGWQPDVQWFDPSYRGKSCDSYSQLIEVKLTHPIYPEHNADYLAECLANLKAKKIELTID